MAHHDIAVMLDSLNQVIVVPNSQHLLASHTVRWICVQGALRIIFPGPESPLKSQALIVSAPGGTTDIEKLRKPSKKRFKYTAEVTPPGGAPQSVDPDLVVEDGGGGPKKKTAAKSTAAKKKTKKK